MTTKQLQFALIAGAAVIGQRADNPPTNWWAWVILLTGLAGAIAGTLKSLDSNPNLPLPGHETDQTITSAVVPEPTILREPAANLSGSGPTSHTEPQ